MIQIMRLDGIEKTSTITKLLANPTPALPSGVTGFVRIKGIASASVILRLLPSTGTVIIPDVLSDNFGEAITDLPGGDTIETIS